MRMSQSAADAIKDENRQDPSEKRNRQTDQERDAGGAKDQHRLHGVEPDEAVFRFRRKKQQAGHPAEPVTEGGRDVLVETARGLSW